MTYDPQELEARWRERWAEVGRYEADPEEAGEKTFVTVPYPYPSGGMHIGHARTYTVPDVYARYRRQRGDEVLFPIAWHVTGTPIVGAVERLKKGEEHQLSVLKETYGVPEEELRDLETPMGFARYFVENHYKKGFRELGLSIDWRREFTTNDERYSKFVTWQYETLRERGLLEKGLHPVKYCTNENNPVTTHDLLEGEEAEFQEFTLIRFTGAGDGIEEEGNGAEVGGSSNEIDSDDGGTEGAIFPMATLRPETVRGVTNAYVDPDAEYVLADVDGERWVISAAAAEKFSLQAREVAVTEEFVGADLVGERVRNPVTGDEVVILPAGFVDADNATGVVMSVPAHSPDDYVALAEIKADAEELAAGYGLDADAIEAIEPIPILEIEGYGEIPARTAVEGSDVSDSADPQLAAVTRKLYQDEFNDGHLLDAYGEFAGEVVREVRDRFREHHRDRGNFDGMYEFTEDVVCRCGGDVEVAHQDTWFLRYDDEEWKEKARRVVEGLDAIPENTREQYLDTIEWLNEWPCIRNYGLGTRLPWDEEFVIEPLSDSTIYMAYYTIAHRLEDIPVEDLDREFFDALFYGTDAVDDPDERALELREEWKRWYPVDYRCSANDLIRNHLTFFLFHHAELFEEPEWPEGITVMGMGLLEGAKMSSSKGNVVLPGDAIGEYGADTVRFFLLNSAEPWQDYDWRAEEVGSVRNQLERFWNRAGEVIDGDAPGDLQPNDLEPIDRWLLAHLQRTVRAVTSALEGFETRTASQEAFYRFEEHIRWYRRRTDLDRPGARFTRKRVLETRIRLLAPFVPFLANELHERLSGVAAEDAPWPEPDPAYESERALVEERLVRDLREDIAEVIEVTGTDPDTIRVYAAADWKRRAFETVRETGPNVGAAMGELMSDETMRERGDEVNALVQDLIELLRERDEETLSALSSVDELAVYERAAEFLAREFDADVECYPEEDAVDPGGKAGNAVPFRPAIHLE